MLIQYVLQFKSWVLLILTLSGMATFGLLALSVATHRKSRGEKKGAVKKWMLTAAIGATLLAPPAYEGTVGGLTETVLRIHPDVGNVGLADELMQASMAEAKELREKAAKTRDACQKDRREVCERIYESEMMRINRKIKRAERAAIEALKEPGNETATQN